MSTKMLFIMLLYFFPAIATANHISAIRQVKTRDISIKKSLVCKQRINYQKTEKKEKLKKATKILNSMEGETELDKLIILKSDAGNFTKHDIMYIQRLLNVNHKVRINVSGWYDISTFYALLKYGYLIPDYYALHMVNTKDGTATKMKPKQKSKLNIDPDIDRGILIDEKALNLLVNSKQNKSKLSFAINKSILRSKPKTRADCQAIIINEMNKHKIDIFKQTNIYDLVEYVFFRYTYYNMLK